MEARKPPLSRAHFFTLAPEERRRRRKEVTDCTDQLALTCQHCGTVKQTKVEETKEQHTYERAASNSASEADLKAGNALEAPVAKRAKLLPHAERPTQRSQSPVEGKKKVGRPKRAVQKSSLTSEMRALLPILLAEQTALSTLPA